MLSMLVHGEPHLGRRGRYRYRTRGGKVMIFLRCRIHARAGGAGWRMSTKVDAASRAIAAGFVLCGGSGRCCAV
jgi:hypothetical protein